MPVVKKANASSPKTTNAIPNPEIRLDPSDQTSFARAVADEDERYYEKLILRVPGQQPSDEASGARASVGKEAAGDKILVEQTTTQQAEAQLRKTSRRSRGDRRSGGDTNIERTKIDTETAPNEEPEQKKKWLAPNEEPEQKKKGLAPNEEPEQKKKGLKKKVLFSQVCCAIGTSPCAFCCTKCPTTKESTSTRFMYILMLIVTISLSVISQIDWTPMDGLSANMSTNTSHLTKSDKAYQTFFGNYLSVYKICIGQLSLHLFLMLVTLGTKNSAIFSGTLHNGFWLWKWAWIWTIIVVFFIYFEDDHHIFWYAFRICGTIGGSLFIVVNIFFMCDVALGLNKSLLDRAAKNKWVYLLIWALTLTILAIAGSFIWLLLEFYSYCLDNFILMFAFMAACGSLLIITVVSGVIKRHKNGDLLQGGIIISYILYQTWRALHSKPTGALNTEVLENVLRITTSSTSTSATSVGTTLASTTELDAIVCRKSFGLGTSSTKNITGLLRYVGLAYYIFIALYKSIDHTRKHAVTMKRYLGAAKPKHVQEHRTGCCYRCKVEHTDAGQSISYNEEKSVLYNYSYMHFQFICSIFFIMMTFTNWFDPGNRITSTPQDQGNWVAFWIEILTAFVAVAVYTLIIVLPALIRILNCRDNVCCRKALTKLPNIQQDALEKAYFTADGQMVTNIGFHNGVIYSKDSHDVLKPVRLVRRMSDIDLPDEHVQPKDYLDVNGDVIPNIESYQGLIYIRDEEILKPVCSVQPYFENKAQDGPVTVAV